MKKKIFNIFKVLFFLATGLFLFWLIYKDQDLNKLKKSLENINYFWILLSILSLFISHIVRTLRWQQMIRPFGYKPRFLNSFFAVMSTYFVNLAVPRLGEVTRPTILKKYEGIPFTTSFGTIVLERVIDLLILLVLTGILLLTQTQVFVDFIANNPEFSSHIKDLTSSNYFIVIIGLVSVCVLGVILFWKHIKKWKLYMKFEHLLKQFLDGLKSFNKVPNKLLFIVYSLLIWMFYFSLSYLALFAFEATSSITMVGALAIFVLGSYGMVAPVQGGIGAWHFMTIAALIVLGVNDQDARIFALIVHAAQTVAIVILGLISTILLPIVNTKQYEESLTGTEG